MKKKSIILILVALLVVTGAAWMLMRPAAGIVIQGDIKPEDVAAIKSLVKKDMRSRIMPNFSPTSFLGLAANLKAYFRNSVVEIDGVASVSAKAWVGKTGQTNDPQQNCEYSLIKNPQGWRILVIYPRFSGRPIMRMSSVIWTNFPGPPMPGTAGAIPFRPMRTDTNFVPGRLVMPPSFGNRAITSPIVLPPPPSFDTNSPFYQQMQVMRSNNLALMQTLESNRLVSMQTLQSNNAAMMQMLQSNRVATGRAPTPEFTQRAMAMYAPPPPPIFTNRALGMSAPFIGAAPPALPFANFRMPITRLVWPNSGLSLTNLLPEKP